MEDQFRITSTNISRWKLYAWLIATSPALLWIAILSFFTVCKLRLVIGSEDKPGPTSQSSGETP